jgi:hypothetical protein
MPRGPKGEKRPADWIGRESWKRWTQTRQPKSANPTKKGVRLNFKLRHYRARQSAARRKLMNVDATAVRGRPAMTNR